MEQRREQAWEARLLTKLACQEGRVGVVACEASVKLPSLILDVRGRPFEKCQSNCGSGLPARSLPPQQSMSSCYQAITFGRFWQHLRARLVSSALQVIEEGSDLLRLVQTRWGALAYAVSNFGLGGTTISPSTALLWTPTLLSNVAYLSSPPSLLKYLSSFALLCTNNPMLLLVTSSFLKPGCAKWS